MMVIKRQLLNHQSKKRIIHLTREGALCQKKKLHALNLLLLKKDQKKGKNIILHTKKGNKLGESQWVVGWSEGGGSGQRKGIREQKATFWPKAN